MAKIRYIGKKPQKVDTQVIAGTGIVWNGKGDVQEVPDKLVHKFLAHSGDFELVTGGKGASASKPTGEKTETKTHETVPKAEEESGSKEDGEKDSEQEPGEQEGEKQEEKQEAPLVNLEGMDKAALIDYAQRNFGHEFHPNTGEAKMRHVIVSLMNRG